MQEVIQKIQELFTLLEEKNKATEVLNAQLSEKKVAVEEQERKQRAAAANLAARERVLRKAEDVDKYHKEAKEAVIRSTKQKAANLLREKELDDREALLKETEAELNKLKELFKKKNEAMDELKVQLETERKLMKEKILDEIKGKL
jgi:hypothetical protein